MSKRKAMERGRPRLKTGREKAAEELAQRIKLGRDLRLPLNPMVMLVGGQMEAAKVDFKKWNDFNYELLRSMFTADEVADSYFNASPHYIRSVYRDDRHLEFTRLLDAYDKRIAKLESITEQLRLYEVDVSAESLRSMVASASPRYRDIHIHNEGSTVGQLNLGQMIGDIETHLQAVTGPDAEVFGRVIKELVESIGTDAKLSDTAKREAIENVELLAAAAAQPPDKRSLGPIKAVLAGMGGLLGAGSSVVTIWQAAEPVLHAHFGI